MSERERSLAVLFAMNELLVAIRDRKSYEEKRAILERLYDKGREMGQGDSFKSAVVGGEILCEVCGGMKPAREVALTVEGVAICVSCWDQDVHKAP